MHQSVQHDRCQCRVAAKGLLPFAEAQIRGQDDRPFFVAFGDHLEEQVRLAIVEGHIVVFIIDQQLRSQHAAPQHFLVSTLPLGALKLQHQVGSADEAHLDAALRGPMAQGVGQMGLAGAAGTEQNDVLLMLQKRHAGLIDEALN